jgi:hypothetical protein
MNKSLIDSEMDSKLDELLLKDVHGILLWGPPGCGKSRSSRELSARHSPMHFINVDELVEHIIRKYYSNEWLKVKDDTSMQKEFYFRIRNSIGIDILSKTARQSDSLSLLFDFATELGHLTLDTTEKTQFTSFLLSNYKIFTLQASTSLYCDLMVWISKARHENFMIESTGNTFDEAWCKKVFGDVSSHLRVVYVDDPETLVNRVQNRAAQLINADPEHVRRVYANSYGHSLLEAMQSKIFRLIDICDNSKDPKIILTLTLSEAMSVYKLEIDTSDISPAAEEFLTHIRDAIGHTKMGANLFCLNTFRWITVPNSWNVYPGV